MPLVMKTILTCTVLFSAAAVHAQTVRQAHDFLNGTYAWLTYDEADDPLADSKAYTAGLIHLFKRDQRLHHSEIGKLDFDPLCDCQDPGNMSYKILDIHKTGPKSALAQMQLGASSSSGSGPEKITLQLLWTSHGWRVDDVRTSRHRSLRTFLLTP